MNKRVYIIVGFVFFLLFATNILNDKYYINYQNRALTVNNASKSSRSYATIYGDSTNQGEFIETPEVDLPKGEYTIKIKYNSDTDLNYVKASGKSVNREISIPEEEKYLSASETEKILKITLDEDVYNLKVDIYFCGQGTFIFRDMTIESVKIVNTDTIAWLTIFSVILITIGILIYHNPTNENRKRVLVLLFLIGITILVSYPLFCDYLMSGDDSSFHLTRIEGIKSGLLYGQFPVRLHTSTYYNYGYAPSIFYPELFLYIPALLRIAGVSTTGTVQIFSVLINFATASIMYFSVYKISKVRSIGILSSILYVFATYHLVDVYARFALGESIAMAFIPLLIYGVYELLYHDYTKWNFVVLGATGILQSHIITTLVAMAFVGLAVVLCFRNLFEKNRLVACVKASIMTILVNLWFIVPFLSMMREDMNISSLAKDVDELTLYVTVLFRNFAVNGEIRNVIGTNMEGVKSLEIGFPILLGVMLFVYILIQMKIQDKKQINLIVSLLGFGTLSAYATTNLFPWKLIARIPLLGEAARMIQFPWRLLAFATAFLAIVASYGVFYLVEKAETRRIMIVAIFAMSALIASRYLDEFSDKEIYCYKGAIVENTGIGTGEYYYKGTKYNELKTRGESITASSESMIVSSFERVRGKLNINIENNSSKEQYIDVPLAYYPFYEAKLNQNSKLALTKGENNVVRVMIPAESKGKIEVKYVKSLLWFVSDIVSAIALGILLLSFFEKANVLIIKFMNKIVYQWKIKKPQ